MRNIVIYVSGPYRATSHHGVWQNIMTARYFSHGLWQQGYTAICPHLNTMFMDGEDADKTAADFIEGDLELVRRSDMIAMIPGWEKSEGAKMEMAEAERIGIPVVYLGIPLDYDEIRGKAKTILANKTKNDWVTDAA